MKGRRRRVDSTPADRIAQLLDRTGPVLHGYMRQLEHDPRDVEEIVADVFMLAHQRSDELAPLADGQVRAWLFRTASNLGKNRARSKKRYRMLIERIMHSDLDLDSGDEFLAVEERIDGAGRGAMTAEVVRSISEHHRRLLIMSALGLTGPEIAAELGISDSAARKRLMHARNEFKVVWAELLDGESEADPGRDVEGSRR